VVDHRRWRRGPLRDIAAGQKPWRKFRKGNPLDEPEDQYSRDRRRNGFGLELPGHRGDAMVELRNSIREALAGDQKNILLNLTEVNHIDSSGLGQLIGSYATVNRGGHPVVSKCRPRPLIP
jgi:hypothetical protein